MKHWNECRLMRLPGKLLGMIALLGLLSANITQVEAATINGLHLLSDRDGQRLNIAMDEASEYQVFNLEGPARLVLSFPNASMVDGVAEVAGDGAVERVIPSQDSNGVRIEVALAKGAKYNISEKGNDLLINFTEEGKNVDSQLEGAVLQDISVKDKGKTTELTLRGLRMDSNHNALITNDGKTMVLDFWGGSSKLPKEHYTYSALRLNDVTVGSAEGRLRLVVSLRPGAGSNHQIDADANSMVLRFGQIESKKRISGLTVEAVDFQPDDRIARLVVRTNEANPIINIKEDDGKVTLDLKNATLASGQERSQDLSAFSGPVKQVDSYGVSKDVRIVARLRQKAVVSSYQSGNVLTLTMMPQDMVAVSAADQALARNEKLYTGQKVTFNYKDIDIRNALQLIAEMSDFNIIMSDDVSGVLTMRLVDVPWDQALDLILQARGLGKEQSGNVVRIAPLGVLKSDADARKDAKASAEEVAPLETEFITLGYASVNDVQTILQGGSVKADTPAGNASGSQNASDTGGSGELKLLSSRGSILLDERSNTMIITDTRERLNNIKRLVAVIDKPTKQVLIEARIVEATDTFSRDLGLKWGGTAIRNTTNYTQTLTGAAAGTNVVDLGAAVGAGAGGAIGYTLAKLGGNLNLNLELSAAEQVGDIKVVSSPRVFTSNLQEALIEQDKQIPFLVTTVSAGGTTTASEMKSSLLSLKVTPQITADGRIIMILEVNKDTPIADAAGGPPSIDKKKVLTKLLVKNGETVVLGGIYSQTESETVNGVPGLMNIPLLGNLFKRKQKVSDRNELLIFITPTIVGDEVSIQ
ncbi:type IV pilus secretin family protein [Mariprofundus aestuarium]|nr:type IV pilus secretin family protein [Mariprofundus aestuarium]